MAKILVLNSGSSSIKFQLYDMPSETVLAGGMVKRIGEEGSGISLKINGTKHNSELEIPDHDRGLREVMKSLSTTGVLGDAKEIDAVGHRVVHGGEAFSGSVIIDDDVEAALEAQVPLAPLHNPPNLLGIRVARDLFPEAVQVGVFDTAFHQTMPAEAYLYPIPKAWYEDHGIRRYGFHGTSHRFVAHRAAEMLGKPLEEVNLITCHLGNGCSITAIQNGKSIDTSMGLTPLEGLVMGTRCGDMDPAIIAHMMRTQGMSIDEVDRALNRQSGLLGISGMTNDCRTIEDADAEGDERAVLALNIYCYRLKKYIGAYTAVLSRPDAIVFTGGVGENSDVIRERSLEGLAPLGYELDKERNSGLRGVEADVSQPGSASRIFVIPTNEELLIARDTRALTKSVQ